MREAGYSVQMIGHINSIISGMKNRQQGGLVMVSISESVTATNRKPTKRHTTLTASQQKLFTGYLESETNQAYSSFVLFQLYTGLRFVECAALQWRDVDMINNVVHVRHSMNKVKGKDVLGAPKAQYSVREVPLNKKAMDVLMKEKARASSDKTPAFDGD